VGKWIRWAVGCGCGCGCGGLGGVSEVGVGASEAGVGGSQGGGWMGMRWGRYRGRK